MKRRLLVLALVAAFVMGAVSPAFAETNLNLVANPGFEGSGVSSDYTQADPGSSALWPEGTYLVGSNPFNYHPLWWSMAANSGTNMLIANGAGDVSKRVWYQEVSLPAAYGTVSSYPLYAGQNWLVGQVLVKNSATQVCVKLVLDPAVVAQDFDITEVHIAVAATVAGIPHNKSGSPVPGQFPINFKLSPGVSETQWYCLAKPAGASIVVAAHAVVARPLITHVVTHEKCIFSGTDAMIGAAPATLAWVHPSWNSNLTMDLPGDGAQWIWNSFRTLQPVTGEIVDFTQGFNIVGTPTGGMLCITADNGFEARVNGTFVGDSTNLAPGWATSDLTEAFVNTGAGVSSWATVRTFDIGGNLLTGANMLAVKGVNEQMDGGTVDSNPAGVIYKLCVTSRETVVDQTARQESAWGGTNPLPGANWAKYISYTPSTATGRYHFSMYAASVYPLSPANLEVRINGVVVATQLLSSVPGVWTLIEGDWDGGTASSAMIAVRDLNALPDGNDFVIDDVSLVAAP